MSFELDMKAVARIASRVSLNEVRLIALNVARVADSDEKQLGAKVERSCTAKMVEPEIIEVTCRYEFNGSDSKRDIATIVATYLLVYHLEESEPINVADLEHFAHANGAYNSWPFLRELLHSMTARMGFPSFVLPVLSFAPPRPRPPAIPTVSVKQKLE